MKAMSLGFTVHRKSVNTIAGQSGRAAAVRAPSGQIRALGVLDSLVRSHPAKGFARMGVFGVFTGLGKAFWDLGFNRGRGNMIDSKRLKEAAGSEILDGGQKVIEGMRLTTGAGEPENGDRFGQGWSWFNDAGETLTSAFPNDSWAGEGADAYIGQNRTQAGRTNAVALLDRGVQTVIAREAYQVAYHRDKLDDQSNFLADLSYVTMALGLVPGYGKAMKSTVEAAAVQAALSICSLELYELSREANQNAAELHQAVGLYAGAAETTCQPEPGHRRRHRLRHLAAGRRRRAKFGRARRTAAASHRLRPRRRGRRRTASYHRNRPPRLNCPRRPPRLRTDLPNSVPRSRHWAPCWQVPHSPRRRRRPLRSRPRPRRRRRAPRRRTTRNKRTEKRGRGQGDARARRRRDRTRPRRHRRGCRSGPATCADDDYVERRPSTNAPGHDTAGLEVEENRIRCPARHCGSPRPTYASLPPSRHRRQPRSPRPPKWSTASTPRCARRTASSPGRQRVRWRPLQHARRTAGNQIAAVSTGMSENLTDAASRYDRADGAIGGRIGQQMRTR